MDLGRVDALEAEIVARADEVSQACVTFLLGEQAFRPLADRLAGLIAKIEAVAKSPELAPFAADLDAVNEGSRCSPRSWRASRSTTPRRGPGSWRGSARSTPS